MTDSYIERPHKNILSGKEKPARRVGWETCNFALVMSSSYLMGGVEPAWSLHLKPLT